MGNRAVITTKESKGNLSLYVHWNGGRDTVLPILKFIKQNHNKKEYKNILIEVKNDKDILKNIEFIYHEVFGNNYKIKDCKKLGCCNADNGVYIIDENFEIFQREYAPSREQKEHNEKGMIKLIKDKLKDCIFFKKNNLYNFVEKLKENEIDYNIIENKLYIEYSLYSLDNPNLRRQINDYKMIFDFINKEDDKKYNHNTRRENNLIKLVDKEEFNKLENKNE